MADLRKEPNTTGKKGSVSTKRDHARRNWYNSLGEILNDMNPTPLFGLVRDPDFSQNRPKRPETASLRQL